MATRLISTAEPLQRRQLGEPPTVAALPKAVPSTSTNGRSFMVVCTIPLARGRDLRLDLFRGLANWAIFLDHFPNNTVAWLTMRNYGFGDATDIFVFISGYTAAFVYSRRMSGQGF
jgi:hypothetical protein